MRLASGPTTNQASSTWPSPRSRRRSWESLQNRQKHPIRCSPQIFTRFSGFRYCCRKSYTEPRSFASLIARATPSHYNCTIKLFGLRERAYQSQRSTSCRTVRMGSRARNAESCRRSFELRFTTSSACFTITLPSMAHGDIRALRVVHLQANAHQNKTAVRRKDLRASRLAMARAVMGPGDVDPVKADCVIRFHP